MSPRHHSTPPARVPRVWVAVVLACLVLCLAGSVALAQVIEEKNLDSRTRLNLLGRDGPIFKPMPEEYVRAGNKAAIVGNHRYAIHLFNEAIDLGGLPLKKLSQAYMSRGISKSKTNQLTEAVYDFAKALEADPSNVPAHYYLAETLRNLGLFTEAVVALNQAVALKPNYAKAFYLRGTVWLVMGDNQLAVNDFDAALKIDPAMGEAYYMRFLAYENMGKLKAALKDLRSFRVYSPLDKSVSLMIRELEERIKHPGTKPRG